MEWHKITKRISELILKYKYVLIIIIIGLVLMAIPFKSDSNIEEINTTATELPINAETQLEEILSQISGVGRVKVMLTTTKGEEILYQTDNNTSGDSLRQETVIITDADRTQSGLIAQVNPPVYLGAIVVCDGADDPWVQLAIVDAVCKITGLGASNISVLKMN